MPDHFNISKQEFKGNKSLFDVLEIKEEQVIGKNHQDLVELLKKQHKKLILVNHPDKGGDENRFDQIYKAYQELKKYIEPLKSGNLCEKVSVDSEGDGHLTEMEFHYRNKLFSKLNITKEEVVGKIFDKLIFILKYKDCTFEKDLQDYYDLKERCNDLAEQIKQLHQKADSFERIKNRSEYLELQGELNQYEAEPSIQLSHYIKPLEGKNNLIKEDKKALAQKFIEHKNMLLVVSKLSDIPLATLTTITIGCYMSWWIIVFNVVRSVVAQELIAHYNTKYNNSEISTDEFIRKMSYLALGCEFLIVYPLAAFSVYLLATNFIANELTVGGVILASFLTLAILVEVLAPIFVKSCEIYTEKNVRDLIEEDPGYRVQEATDLLKWYDLRKLLMPIIMPFVKKCFTAVDNELAERNFDEEVSTNISYAIGISQPVKQTTLTTF
ncbi:molecular chaperone DnaJ [Wolbachia endosymbiont of Chironomus riparius]|uniref:molecular chaperone DnaJ n=1 Tax=Wolbachia endosymbiont of Chironomus riparius TaxID=2883238 RepID=UPI00209EFA9E|nr:molecular chaperone DnaJ [Wolbachia endosymbiont of Chironomus riparius]